jgi:hypothetical protein
MVPEFPVETNINQERRDKKMGNKVGFHVLLWVYITLKEDFKSTYVFEIDRHDNPIGSQLREL